MGTTFHIRFKPGTELARMAADKESAARAAGQVPESFSGDHLLYTWDANVGMWYVTYLSIMLTIPDQLVTYLASEDAQFELVDGHCEKSAAVVDRRSAIQGEYVGDGARWRIFRRRRFNGCTATVDNYVANSGERQSITVTGPPEVFGEYMALIRSRRIRPVRRLEPSWFRMVLGF